MVVEAVSLQNIYNIYATSDSTAVSKKVEVKINCSIVNVNEDVYVGIASLADMYGMLSNYADQSDGTIDGIYDRNIRKYLKRRVGSVNDGIYQTLEKSPERFIAYNNGITIICRSIRQIAGGLILEMPYIVNGCQTTRTIYDFMNTKFAGIDVEKDPKNRMGVYKSAFMAIKILVVQEVNNDIYANNVSRFSNKQNAIRGKDFIALEEMYKRLKDELKSMGYFLET